MINMLVPYECCLKQYEDYYTNQSGNGLSYYRGQSLQRGYGIGGWFKRLFRTALPFLTRGAKSVGKEVLKTSTHIANDILEGKKIEDSAKQRGKEAGKNLVKKALQSADGMLGKGKIYKRKKKQSKRFISSSAKKAKGRDIFDHP